MTICICFLCNLVITNQKSEVPPNIAGHYGQFEESKHALNLMQRLTKHKSLDPFIKDIFLLENKNIDEESNLPFYADGYPGIIYSESAHPFFLRPKNKELADFYLFGQTIEPISLHIKGSYRLIFLRLYPFAARLLLGIDSKELNDDCYDLLQLNNIDTAGFLQELKKIRDTVCQLDRITSYFNELVKLASVNTDSRIKLAVNLIISTEGKITIREVREKLYITERTFERQFTKEIGVTPKQFAKIIQFSASLNQITDKDYTTLTELGYVSGFADQSHFIKTFKRYTGKTPKEYQKQISA